MPLLAWVASWAARHRAATFGQIAKRMLCDRCQSKEAMVHITTILHVWLRVDRERVVAGPTVGEGHLCTVCAQSSLAVNPLLNPRTDPLPAVGAQPVMLFPRDVTAFKQWLTKYHPRLKWTPPPNQPVERIASGGRLCQIRKGLTVAIAYFRRWAA